MPDTNRSEAARKAALTRKRRAAGKKAAETRRINAIKKNADAASTMTQDEMISEITTLKDRLSSLEAALNNQRPASRHSKPAAATDTNPRMSVAEQEKWRTAGLKSWETRRRNDAERAKGMELRQTATSKRLRTGHPNMNFNIKDQRSELGKR